MTEHNVEETQFADTIECPECHNRIPASSMVCPKCGFPISEAQTVPAAFAPVSLAKKNSVLQLIGAVLCLLTVVCVIVGVTRITNDKYKFYMAHYQECIDAYEECVATASSFGYGFFRSAYNDLADDYLELANEDKKDYMRFRVQAVSWCCSGAVLFVLGGWMIKKGRT